MTRYLRKLLLVGLLLVFALPTFGQAQLARVLINTSLGEIEIELYLERAPVTASNFLRLVEGGHLDSGSFYRTVTYANDNGSPKIEVIQGGRNGNPGPFPAILHESTDLTGILHTDGVVSMSRSEVGTASTEFFICIGDQPGLDFGKPRNADNQGFAAFGKVVRGMDVVRAINRSPAELSSDAEYTQGQIIAAPVVIESVVRI